MAPLPLIKLVGLFLKQASKPVANALKARVKTHPFIRDRVCVPIGRGVHSATERMSRLTVRPSQRVPIRPISDEKAMSAGAEFIGEATIYFIAVLVLLGENRKSKQQKADQKANEEASTASWNKLQSEHDELLKDFQTLKADLVELREKIELREKMDANPGSKRCSFSKKL